MADHMIRRACERFQKGLLPQDATLIQSTISLDDVKTAIQKIECELAARQSLRNFQRITPFVDAIDRYSKAIEVAANGTPYLPWLWAPLKIILQGTSDCTHALDKILNAYGQIGNTMPRLTRYTRVFPQHQDFQRLVAFLFEDIMEFHRKSYSFICKPGWKIYFASLWGLFEHRFESLLKNIAYISELIDKEAVSLDITLAAEKRERDLAASKACEIRWKTEQLHGVLDWLGTGEGDPELNLEWLRSRCHEGTAQWVTRSPKLRSWLQQGRGSNLLWLYGKPGSGKSVLSSQIIYFLRSDPARHVVFFFCDFHTPPMGVTAYILKSLCAQLVRMSSDLVPFLYTDYVSKGKKVAASTLKEILTQCLAHFQDIRIVLDGIDELPRAEHKTVIRTICEATDLSPTCKTLIVSQDIPSIATSLSKRTRMCISEEKDFIQQDMEIVVGYSLKEINDMHEGFIEEQVLQDIKWKILEKAQGMFLWVRLVLDLLENSTSVQDLHEQLNSLPRDLVDAYEKILSNMRNRCSDSGVTQIQRVFSWLLCQRGKLALRKHQIRIGMGIYPSSPVPTRDTRPFPNATDICKPFIEDGPGGSLVFIHSTVPKFLLEHGETPFINWSESQRIIAFACVAQLNQAIDLFSHEISLSDQSQQLCVGVCGLLPYANEYWISHLAEYAKSRQRQQRSGHDELSQQLYMLSQRLEKSGIVGLKENPPKGEQGLDKANIPMRIQQLIDRFSRTEADAEVPNEQTGCTPLLQQKTSEYHDRVHYILKQKSLPGVAQSDLITFKKDHGPTAFICEEAGCDRSVIGFPSEKELRDHAHRHQQNLRCYEKECAYNDVGFMTERSLTNHKRKFHQAEEVKPIPKRLKSETYTPHRLQIAASKSKRKRRAPSWGGVWRGVVR